MKKTVTLLAALLLMGILVLCGCSGERSVTAVTVKDHDGSSAYEMVMGGFDYSAFTLLVSYDSGESEELALTEEMIAAADRLLFYQEGEHSLTVSYGGVQTALRISVKRNEYNNVSFPQELTFTYNGEAHVVEVEGDVPAGTVVTYPQGNSFVNAGTYDVTAILTGDTYVSKQLTATVTVERATYDMSGVRFEGREVVYNGRQHLLSVSGTLPSGVPKPVYFVGSNQVAGAVEAGNYTVTAHFPVTDPNYHPVPDMQASLVIKQATYTVSGCRLVGLNKKGEPFARPAKVYDGEAVSVSVADTSVLPRGTAVAYRVQKDGGVQSEEMESVSFSEAGRYTVTAFFTLADSKNYQELPPVSLTFEVARADYDMSGVHFDWGVGIYDEKEHSIAIDGELPEGVTVDYVYYLNGVPVMEGDQPSSAVRTAGSYQVEAVFTHENANYNEIPCMTAVLEIRKKTIDVSGVSYESNGVFVFDGACKSPAVSNLPEGVEVERRMHRVLADGTYEEISADGAIHVGEYSMTARLVPTDAVNYVLSVNVDTSLRFRIQPAPIGPVDVTFDFSALTLVYDGTSKVPAVSLDDTYLTYTLALYRVSGGEATLLPDGQAIDAGSYRLAVSLAPISEDYTVVGDSVILRDYEIAPQLLTVSAVLEAVPPASGTVYNGLAHTVQLNGLETLDARTRAVVTISRRNDYGQYEVLEKPEAVNAGEYQYTVSLEVVSGNYTFEGGVGAYELLTGSFTIQKQSISVSGCGFAVSEAESLYSGKAQTIEVVGCPELVGVRIGITRGGVIVSEAIAPGLYQFLATLYPLDSENYQLSGDLTFTATLLISPGLTLGWSRTEDWVNDGSGADVKNLYTVLPTMSGFGTRLEEYTHNGYTMFYTVISDSEGKDLLKITYRYYAMVSAMFEEVYEMRAVAIYSIQASVEILTELPFGFDQMSLELDTNISNYSRKGGNA